MEKFDSPEYVRSRRAYITQCTVEYFVSLLVTDAFLSRLLSNVGMSDSLVGIISSFVTLAFVFQFLTLFVVKIKASSKKLVMIFDTLSILCYMFMYFIPFLPFSTMYKSIFLMVALLGAYIFKYLILNICFKWGNSFVEPTHRASFSAGKEMISLFTGMIFTALMGYVIDKYEAAGNLTGGFLFIALSILVLNICNFISLALIKRDEPEQNLQENESVTKVIKKLMANKSFKSVIVLTVLWDVARYFSVGFLGIFKYKDLLMTAFLVQVINIIASVARMFVSKPFGRYSDRTSFSKGFKLGLCLAAASFFVNIFVTKSTWVLIIVHTVLYNCCMAGTNQNSFNIVYSYVDSQYITQAMAIKNCIGGLFGFGASLIGGKILEIIQSNGNMVFGVHIYGQQILAVISFAVTVVAIIYTQKVIEKQKVMIQ